MADDAFSVDWMQGWHELQRNIWTEWAAMVGEKMPGVSGADSATQWPLQWLQQVMGVGSAPSWTPPNMGMGGMGGMGNAAPWSMPWMQQPPSFGQGMPLDMDQWTKSFGVYTPELTPEAFVISNMTAATEGFMRVSKDIFQVLQKMGEGAKSGEEWPSMLDKAFQQAKSLFGNRMAGQAAMDPMAAWSQPMQMWMGMLKNNPMFSNPVLQSFTDGSSGFPAMQGMETWLGQVLGMPGLGITREKQERLQGAMRDGLAYQKAFQAFQELSNQVNQSALDLLQKKLLERGATNKPLESLRELYVLWVDCSEEANAAFVRGQEYQEASSRMTNALMRVQQHVQGMVDEVLTTFKMPTRRELDSAHRQVHDLKRRLRTLEDEVKVLRTRDVSAELSAIRDDLERMDVRNLRQELTSMKSQLESSLPATGSVERKAPARSRAVPREKSDSSSPTAAAKKGA